eukprot:GHVP01025215.1.p1 GENE.GHVP01025215.1~~GHVP01025215.1.p1  ORF type:complete len:200 (+),score=38.97 GHVP01025215.1:3-602(+)
MKFQKRNFSADELAFCMYSSSKTNLPQTVIVNPKRSSATAPKKKEENGSEILAEAKVSSETSAGQMDSSENGLPSSSETESKLPITVGGNSDMNYEQAEVFENFLRKYKDYLANDWNKPLFGFRWTNHTRLYYEVFNFSGSEQILISWCSCPETFLRHCGSVRYTPKNFGTRGIPKLELEKVWKIATTAKNMAESQDRC